jgi:hypothetical protein
MVDQTVNFRTRTNGTGYWSPKQKFVTINRIELAYVDDEEQFGELRAYFDPAEWDIDNDGLIYSDPGWKRSFLTCLESMGFSTDAILHVSYSEQGMQGGNYVSMDVGSDFIQECEALYRFVINQQVVNM